MTKPYYSDPLAAAWMAQHFGMKFIAYHSDEQMSEYDLEESEREFDWMETGLSNEDYAPLSDILDKIYTHLSRAYIHPDSMHLLKSQPGDILIIDGVTTTIPARIIERDGKPFHWPEGL